MVIVALALAAAPVTGSAETVARALIALLAIGVAEPQAAEVGMALGLPLNDDERWTNQPLTYREAMWEFPASQPLFRSVRITRQPDDGNGHFGELIEVYLQEGPCIRFSKLARVMNVKPSLFPNLTSDGGPGGVVQVVHIIRKGSLGRSATLNFDALTSQSCVDEVYVTVDGPVN